MKRAISSIKKGALVKKKYNIDEVFGITTSNVEYHSPMNSGTVTAYIWVLWDDGDHHLYKVDMLEEVNESR